MTGLMAGESLYAENVPLPAGVTLISDPKMTVVHLSLRSAQEEIVAAPVVAEGATPAEGAAATDGAAAGEKKDDK
jgi:large subunit ribosomal protein L25